MLVFRSVRILTLATAAVVGIAHGASAATFDGVGTHTLTSSNLGFSAALGGVGSGWAHTDAILTVNVPAGGATATVTSAHFTHCTGTGAVAGLGCATTATGLPWRLTTLGVAGNFVIDGVHLTNAFTSGATVTLEGNLNGAFNNTTHTATFANSTGLTATSLAFGNGAATVSGTFTDNLNTLVIT